MTSDAKIRARVMRRVWALYWARQLARPAPRAVAFGVLAYGLLSSVSVVNVAVNALAFGSVAELARFAYVAFVTTTPYVQGITLALTAMLGWFSFDAAKRAEVAMLPERETVLAQ